MRSSLLFLLLLGAACLLGAASVSAASPRTRALHADVQRIISDEMADDALLEAEMEMEMETETEAESGVQNYSLTQAQLASAAGLSSATAGQFLNAINSAAAKYGINSAKRMAGFLAQVGHESGGFTRMTENLSYSAAGLRSTFGKYFNAAQAKSYAGNPTKIGNRAYANRMGNGNEASGDGFKYRGRGLIQITGKAMYQQCGSALGLNLIANPDLLAQTSHAVMSAAWYWSSKGCNAAADRADINGMTRPINPALHNMADRRNRYTKAKSALGVK